MVSAVLPVPQATLLNGSKGASNEALPSHVPSTSNGVKSNGIHKSLTNGVSKPEYYVNGYHKDIPTPSQRVQEPRNSCDVVFGPKDKEDSSYRMLNQPLGQKRPLKVVYLGGGAINGLCSPPPLDRMQPSTLYIVLDPTSLILTWYATRRMRVLLAHVSYKRSKRFVQKVRLTHNALSGFENKYPGCACDIPSHTYQFTWALYPDWPK
jgi:hypothetical protein